MAFPYVIHQVSGSDALDTLSALAAAGGGFPVLLGDADEFEQFMETYEDNAQPVDGLIALARGIDAHTWFAGRLEIDPEYEGDDEEEDEEAGEYPDGAASAGLSSHLNVLTQEPHAAVNIVVIPAAEAWMVPCYLGIGGWNECPNAEEHAAIFKYWGEKYGATVACITSDVIEMTVARPPATKEEALALAREQYIYCPDIVDQGTESVAALAAGLLNSRVWFFWWD
jgi:hypothetical protein